MMGQGALVLLLQLGRQQQCSLVVHHPTTTKKWVAVKFVFCCRCLVIVITKIFIVHICFILSSKTDYHPPCLVRSESFCKIGQLEFPQFHPNFCNNGLHPTSLALGLSFSFCDGQFTISCYKVLWIGTASSITCSQSSVAATIFI
jgi:hypothetical protein